MAETDRPASIRAFERLFYLGLGAAALNAWARADNAAPLAYRDWSRPGYILVDLVISTALNLLLLWLIAYRRSNFARWIFVGLVLLGMVANFVAISHALDDGALSLALTLIQYLLCAMEIFLLFRPDMRGWFAGVQPVDPKIFE